MPARNEAANIGWVLERVPDSVDEIVLVDGRSRDETIRTARLARPDVRIVEQDGEGKGDALAVGFRAARGDVIVMMDADGSMSPAEIPHYLYFLSQGFDLVKGSRFMLGGGSLDITRTRRAGNRALMSLVNNLYGVPLTDLCYGFVAFHRHALEHLDLTSTGFEVETRLTVSALRAGLRIAEVPSLELPRRAGVSNLRTWRDGSRVLGSILRDYETTMNEQAMRLARRWPRRPGRPWGDDTTTTRLSV
ncbi:glycosyltransferase family 2 protein [Actinomycetospora chiangmaiensis]|uniref:glycosyltransferase family 2 protein n=1 Tax=Actinomycetospora chiangmaiensis TaxID=402650 RepID=UPI0003621829|nr:glycosyltransferase family 2 protein [Actinomycetospora chiangmaiensis]